MRISVEDFIKMSEWELFDFSPFISFSDEICLLTCKDVSDIDHAVKASDGRIYDVFALHTWLSQQEKKYIIPGLNIEYVDGFTFLYYSFCSIINQYISVNKESKVIITTTEKSVQTDICANV